MPRARVAQWQSGGRGARPQVARSSRAPRTTPTPAGLPAVRTRSEAKLTERQFMQQVITAAELLGWKYYHTHNSRRSPKGFPDLVLAKPGLPVVYAELKKEGGRLTREQRDWLALLALASGTEVYVWRPSNAAEIEKVLTR